MPLLISTRNHDTDLQADTGNSRGSNAIATAAHFGLPQEVISTARSSLEEGSRRRGTADQHPAGKAEIGDIKPRTGGRKDNIHPSNKELSTELTKFKEEKQN